MGMQNWVSPMSVIEAAGASFGTFTTAKTVIPATGLRTIRANELFIGAATRLTVTGGIGTLVTTPGTITFQVMIGSVIAWTSGAIQLNATAHTNIPFMLELLLTCRSIGSGTSATLMGQGKVTGIMFTNTAGQTDGANSNTVKNVPATAAAVGTGFDSTIDNIMDFWAGFSISDAANTVKIEGYVPERLNW